MSNTNQNTLMLQLPRNIFSGFVVSLVALPLGLGLALLQMTSHFWNNCHCWWYCVQFWWVTVNNNWAGNGLVVVVLSSIAILGGPYAGYLYTCRNNFLRSFSNIFWVI